MVVVMHVAPVKHEWIVGVKKKSRVFFGQFFFFSSFVSWMFLSCLIKLQKMSHWMYNSVQAFRTKQTSNRLQG